MSSFKLDAEAGAELTAQWQERNAIFLPASRHNTLKLSAFDTKGFVAFTIEEDSGTHRHGGM